jgi:hypothetical protein
MLCLWLFRLTPCFFSVFPFSLFSLPAAPPLSLSLSSVAVALERFACAFSFSSRQISSSCSNSVVVAAAAAYLVLVSAGLPSQFSSLVCFLHTTQDLYFLFFFSSQGFASLLLLFAFKAGALEGNRQRAHLYGLNIAVSPLHAAASFLPFRLSS